MFIPFLIRFVLPGLLIVAFCLSLIGYGKHLESVERDAALLVQEESVKVIMLKQAENLASVQFALDQARKERSAQVKIIHKKVVQYVHDQAEKCVEPPTFVELFDAISGVPSGSANRLPSPISPSGQSDELPTGDASAVVLIHDEIITSAEVMQAYEHAVNALREIEGIYFALVKWVNTEYTIQREGLDP